MEQSVRIAAKFARPLIMNTDSKGYMLNGFEVGQHDAYVSAYNLPFDGTVRIFMVPHQYTWLLGDQFQPVTLANGRPAFSDVDIKEGQNSFTHRIVDADELMAGAYDYIIRPLRYGYEDDEFLMLRDSDHVTRFHASLIVRRQFSQWIKWVTLLKSLRNTQSISGRISQPPYFQYANTFQLGENIYGALDPTILNSSQKGKMVALYIVKRPVANYSMLNHLPQLGGNMAVQKFLTQTDSLSSNKRLLWSNANEIGEYEIIADFGNNPVNTMAFGRQ
ncbi:MAG: hypothetical protein IPP22_08155 [Nitrosomonas sp.]|nr:hypothetical protein [Nitrosomonas sp.]